VAVTVDPITNGDFTRIDRADGTGGWTLPTTTPVNGWSMIALNTASQVENTGCIEAGKVNAGVGISFASFTSRSLENVHLRMWCKLSQSISALATYGARLQIGDQTNLGAWTVYGSDKQVAVYNGWLMLVVDPRKPFDEVIGTVPSDILAVVDAGCRVDFVDANGKALAVHDMLWEGNEVSIEGGTTGARGTFLEWSAADVAAGYGILRDVGGVFYLNAGALFQGPGTAASYFEDTNAVVIFEDLPVSGSMYKFRHVGNADASINHFQLGTTSGSGVDQEGAGGGVLRAAGAAPFRVEAIDADVDAVNYYGVTMLGNDAVYADQLRNVKVEDNGTGFTDVTSNANGGTGRTDQVLMPATQALNDATYFGHDERFYALNLNLVTAKGGTWTGTWEYYDGTTWSSLTDVTDGTANYATTGAQAVNWAIPDDWAATAIDSDTRYWVRFRISAFTSSGTNPTQESNTDGTTVDMAGDIRLEDPNVDMVGCSLTGMGSVRVRNGAFLKKTTIDSSVVPAKHAALDLGSADPSADTVRDVTIQNCSKGILLKGSGNTTYNIRGFVFSGNTNDFRVDYGPTDTVTINLVDNTSSDTSFVEANQDLVDAGTTVNFVSTVTLSVTVEDVGGTGLEDVIVSIRDASDNSLISQGRTNASGVYADATYNYASDTPVVINVRKSSPGDTRYFPAANPGLIIGTGLSTTVALNEDTNAGLIDATRFDISKHGQISNDVSGTTLTAKVKLPGGTRRKLVVGCGYWDATANLTVTSLNYDGNAMVDTAGGNFVQEGSEFHEMFLYRYDIPDADEGTKDIVLTLSAAAPIRFLAFAIINLAGTGAEEDDANSVGQAVTSNPSISLNNTTQPAIDVMFSVTDDLDTFPPAASGVGSIRRADKLVDGGLQLTIIRADRAATGAHSIGATYDASSKSYVSAGATFAD